MSIPYTMLPDDAVFSTAFHYRSQRRGDGTGQHTGGTRSHEMPYRTLKRERIISFWVAVLLWLVLGYCVGWYRAATSPGDAGWPLPAPVAAAGFLACTFGLYEVDPPLMRALWLLLFPCAGMVWVALQCLTAPYFDGRRADFLITLRPYAWSSLPTALSAPLVAFLLWRDWGAVLRPKYLLDFAEYYGDLWPWLGTVFVSFALVSLLLHVLTHRKTFELRGRAAWAHFLVSLALLIVTATGAAALLDGLIRPW